MRRNDTQSRSDRVLFAALAIVLATVSATLGSAMSYRPNAAPVVATAVAAPQSAQDMILAQLVAEHRCLTDALYYEARGEGRIGEQAVAQVVFSPTTASHYRHSIP